MGIGKVLVKVPTTLRFVMDGEMPHFLLAKDLILQIIGEIFVCRLLVKYLFLMEHTEPWNLQDLLLKA